MRVDKPSSDAVAFSQCELTALSIAHKCHLNPQGMYVNEGRRQNSEKAVVRREHLIN